MTVSIDDIRAAARTIEGAVLHTPTVRSPTLSEEFGADIRLKLENLQYTGSFKERGALVKLTGLDAAQRRAGIVAVSAGNHAQGVARHAGKLGIPATIVMPKGTPFLKVENTERLGARVLLEGASLAEATDFGTELAAREGRVLIHPYDDDEIIAGQGTVALEMLADAPDLDVLVIPIGGGGLIAGNAIAAKALRPEIEIVGVEAAAFASMRAARAGAPPPPGGPTLAEGIAVRRPGTRTRPVVEALVSDILAVDEAAIEAAVHKMVGVERLVVEGAGAAPLAALIASPERFAGRQVGLLVSGGNIDARLLATVLMRGLVRDGRLQRLRIEVSDIPGSLAEVTEIIGAAEANIVEIHHRRLFQDVPVKLADLDVVVETRDREHGAEILGRLRSAGFDARLLSSRALDPTGDIGG